MKPPSLLNLIRADRGHADRNFGLDLVRAIAIILVVLCHGRFFLLGFDPFRAEIPAIALFKNGGFFGVELFFVLSGFLIGGILIRTWDKNDGLNFKLVGQFWIRRWFRTIPNYMLFLLLNATLFQWMFFEKQFSWRYLVFAQNLAWEHPDLMPLAWSLSVEEWFYVTLPLTMVWFAVMPIKSQARLLIAVLFYMALFTFLRCVIVTQDDPESWDAHIRKVVLYRLDALGYGVLFAYLMHYRAAFMNRLRIRLLCVGLALTTAAVAANSYGILHEDQSFFGREGQFGKLYLFPLTSLGLVLTLPWFAALPAPAPFIVSAVRHISLVSYSMYLLHVSFVVQLMRHFFLPATRDADPRHHMPWYVISILYWVLTIVLSTAVFKWYERPMTNLREKFARSG